MNYNANNNPSSTLTTRWFDPSARYPIPVIDEDDEAFIATGIPFILGILLAVFGWLRALVGGLVKVVCQRYWDRVAQQVERARVGTIVVRSLDDDEEWYETEEDAWSDGKSVDSCDRHGVPPTRRDVKRVAAFAAMIAREVRTKLGPNPRYTSANEKVAWELANKLLEEMDVRKCDRMRFLPLATKMCFIPTVDDVMANQIGNSAAVSRRLEEAEDRQPWWLWRPGKGAQVLKLRRE